ncbi:hypothetical protein M231_04745 [Tremella mesenterica]|uniref:Uncharacterized protein n=1 Tax=Tremella mesenterica TaxID=5217 RepID=A0A4Q1BJQ0_TREME|nr:hypothetical protein M231_04745 [Tremella mesenterica]
MDEANRLSTTEEGLPSINEVRLTTRVLELEQEKEDLQKELDQLRKRQIPSEILESNRIHIPHDLFPVLNLLRKHIAELTRDNEALRRTFIGIPNQRMNNIDVKNSQVGESSTRPKGNMNITSPKLVGLGMTPTTPFIPTRGPAGLTDIKLEMESTTDYGRPEEMSTRGKGKGMEEEVKGRMEYGTIDLNVVVERVKSLLKENDELGEMVLELGKIGKEEWEKALEESKSVITSLDADLTHHLSTIQQLRKEIQSYKERFGPLVPIPTHTSKPRNDTPNKSSRTENISTKSISRSDSSRRGNERHHGGHDRHHERSDSRSNRGHRGSRGSRDRSRRESEVRVSQDRRESEVKNSQDRREAEVSISKERRGSEVRSLKDKREIRDAKDVRESHDRSDRKSDSKEGKESEQDKDKERGKSHPGIMNTTHSHAARKSQDDRDDFKRRR